MLFLMQDRSERPGEKSILAGDVGGGQSPPIPIDLGRMLHYRTRHAFALSF